MRIFVAGASGALGKQLVPRLVAGGHEVVGMTRSERSARAGAGDGRATRRWPTRSTPRRSARAVSAAEPEVIVHQLTALSGSLDLRHFDRDFAATNRLRTEGTDHLLSAARAAGVRRFVAQSYAGWPYARIGGPVKSEEDPLDPDPPRRVRSALDAIRHLEQAVTGAELDRGHRAALRRASTARDVARLEPVGEHVEAIRKRKFPIVGDGAGRLVVRAHRGRGRGHGRRGRARRRRPPTTSSTTIPAAVRDWLPAPPRRSARSRRGGSRAGSAGCSPARRRRS